jgi:hypothetical protein
MRHHVPNFRKNDVFILPKLSAEIVSERVEAETEHVGFYTKAEKS